MVQRQIEPVVDEEHFAQPVAFLHFLDFGHHFVDGADDPPVGPVLRCAAANLRRAGGVGKAAQLGQHADAESGLAVFVHIQPVQARRLGELRHAVALVQLYGAVLGIHQPRQAVHRRLAHLQAVAEFGKGFPGVAHHAQVGLQVAETLPGQQAESRAAANDGGAAFGADSVDDFLGDGQRPLGVDVAVIAEVPQRNAGQVRLKFAHRLPHFGGVVVGEHQIQHPDFVAGGVQMAGDVGQADGQGLGVHPAVQPVMAVGGNQQDAHRELRCSAPQRGRQRWGRPGVGGVKGWRGSRVILFRRIMLQRTPVDKRGGG